MLLLLLLNDQKCIEKCFPGVFLKHLFSGLVWPRYGSRLGLRCEKIVWDIALDHTNKVQ